MSETSERTVKLSELLRKVGMTVERGAPPTAMERNDWRNDATGWTCKLRYQGRQLTVGFWTGRACVGEPKVEDVLGCLLSDAQGGEQTFEDFCGEFGNDPDSRKAERTWKACGKTAQGLHRLLRDDYERFMYAERD